MWALDVLINGMIFGAVFFLCFLGAYFYIKRTTKVNMIKKLIELIDLVEKNFEGADGDVKKELVITKFYIYLDTKLKGTHLYFIYHLAKIFISRKLIDNLIEEAFAGMRVIMAERQKALEDAEKAKLEAESTKRDIIKLKDMFTEKDNMIIINKIADSQR